MCKSPSPLCPPAVLSFSPTFRGLGGRIKMGLEGSRRAQAWGGGETKGVGWKGEPGLLLAFSPEMGQRSDSVRPPSSPFSILCQLPPCTEDCLAIALPRNPSTQSLISLRQRLGDCKQFSLSDFISLKGLSLNAVGLWAPAVSVTSPTPSQC